MRHDSTLRAPLHVEPFSLFSDEHTSDQLRRMDLIMKHARKSAAAFHRETNNLFHSYNVFVRYHDETSFALIVLDSKRHGAKVRIRIDNDASPSEIANLAYLAATTLGRISHRIDHEDFAKKKIIYSDGNYYIERSDGTCLGLSSSYADRYVHIIDPTKPIDTTLVRNSGEISFIDPSLPNIGHAEIQRVSQQERLTRDAKAREEKELADKMQREFEALAIAESEREKILAIEKEQLYSKDNFGIF